MTTKLETRIPNPEPRKQVPDPGGRRRRDGAAPHPPLYRFMLPLTLQPEP